MNALRKKIAVLGIAGSVGLAAVAVPSVSAVAAPVAPSQNSVKQSAPSQTDNVRWRRGGWVGPAVALGVIGAIAASQHRHRYYGYGPYYQQPYYPAYYGYAPRYYGPSPYYYGW